MGLYRYWLYALLSYICNISIPPFLALLSQLQLLCCLGLLLPALVQPAALVLILCLLVGCPSATLWWLLLFLPWFPPSLCAFHFSMASLTASFTALSMLLLAAASFFMVRPCCIFSGCCFDHLPLLITAYTLLILVFNEAKVV